MERLKQLSQIPKMQSDVNRSFPETFVVIKAITYDIPFIDDFVS